MSIIIITLFIPLLAQAQSKRILLDEDFSDWENIDVSYTDPTGDQTSGSIDFGKLWIGNDDAYLFMRIEVGAEINLQDLNEIVLFIDTDNNPSSGLSVSGIGADLEFVFGQRSGTARLNGSFNSIRHIDIGLVSSPTVSSTQFELGIRRDAVISGKPLFTGNKLKVAFKSSPEGEDNLPNEAGGVKYEFISAVYETLPPYSITKTNNDYLRVMSYNVKTDGFFESNKKPAFTRIIRAIRPQIIGFQEIYNHTSQQTANEVELIIPSLEGEYWYHSKNIADIVTVSRYPITQTFSIEGNGAFLIDLRPDYDSDLLFISAHPPCCSNNEGRQREIDAMMAFVRDAKEPGGILTLSQNNPIIIVGDMNLVGFAQQRKTLLTGDIVNEDQYGSDFIPDWDGTGLEDTKPFTTNLPATFTWYDEGNSFSPGRLDYIVYTNSIIQEKNSFALFTKRLPADTLTRYDLVTSDAVTASDHLPIVSDFEMTPVTSLAIDDNEFPKYFSLEQNYPNPFNPTTTIKYSIPNVGARRALPLQIVIYDVLGNEVTVLVNENKSPGFYEIEFNADRLPSGIYFYKLVADNKLIAVKKMVLIK